MLQDGGDIALGAQDGQLGIRYTDDALYMPLQAGTQWDAFAHIFHDGQMYNGFGLEHVTSRGATRGSIDKVVTDVVTRGVLLDLPRQLGQDWLQPGTVISSRDLEECAAAQGVTVERGDAVLVRTGHIAQCRARGSWGDYALGDAPGLGLDSAHFLCQREIAAVATDTWGAEVRPNEIEGTFQPLHLVLIVHAGILVGEIFDLDALAEDCARDGRYDFLFVGAPLHITGAVGSPLTPLAIK
jgi:kynurenine formamidase